MTPLLLLSGSVLLCYGLSELFGLFDKRKSSTDTIVDKSNARFYFRLYQSKNVLGAGMAFLILGLIGLFT
jgi:hypothetical protein